MSAVELGIEYDLYSIHVDTSSGISRFEPGPLISGKSLQSLWSSLLACGYDTFVVLRSIFSVETSRQVELAEIRLHEQDH